MLPTYSSAVLDAGNVTSLGSNLSAKYPMVMRGGRSGFGVLGRRGLACLQARAVTAHIEANLGEPVRVADMARVARLSPSRFSNAFRASFGWSPHAYITQRRLECAMEMMLSTHEPLCQIAAACGFCDQAHFSRHFHRRFGMAPRVLRRHLRAQRDPTSASSVATLRCPPSRTANQSLGS